MDKVNWIQGYIVSHEVDNNPGSIFGSNIFLPSRCYTVAGWGLDQTKGDHGTVRWRRGTGALPKGFSVGSPALCTYYGESQSVVGKHNLEIMKDN